MSCARAVWLGWCLLFVLAGCAALTKALEKTGVPVSEETHAAAEVVDTVITTGAEAVADAIASWWQMLLAGFGLGYGTRLTQAKLQEKRSEKNDASRSESEQRGTSVREGAT